MNDHRGPSEARAAAPAQRRLLELRDHVLGRIFADDLLERLVAAALVVRRPAGQFLPVRPAIRMAPGP
ncbi:MAG: hypothetical protein U1F10_01680 [Burkholderiales bacterium]